MLLWSKLSKEDVPVEQMKEKCKPSKGNVHMEQVEKLSPLT